MSSGDRTLSPLRRWLVDNREPYRQGEGSSQGKKGAGSAGKGGSKSGLNSKEAVVPSMFQKGECCRGSQFFQERRNRRQEDRSL